MSFAGPERLPQISAVAKRNYGNEGYDTYFRKIWIREELAFDWANNNINLWSYIHGRNHETILLDTNSPLMTTKKAEILAQCRGRSLPRSLENVNELINQITDQRGKTRSQVEAVIGDQLKAHLLTLKALRPRFYTTIDELMEAKLMVCRQKAMIATGLLAHLVKKGDLKGKVRLYRTFLEKDGEIVGGHAWALFRDEATQHLWICDPRWEKVINVTLNKADADRYYGKVTIDNMIERANSQDILKSFKRAIDPFIGGISPVRTANLDKPSEEYPFEHLKLVLSDDPTQNFAIRQALRNCYVEYEKEVKAGVTTLILKASNNPLLAKLDIPKLKAEYETINKAQIKKVLREERQVLEDMLFAARLARKAKAEKPGLAHHKARP